MAALYLCISLVNWFNNHHHECRDCVLQKQNWNTKKNSNEISFVNPGALVRDISTPIVCMTRRKYLLPLENRHLTINLLFASMPNQSHQKHNATIHHPAKNVEWYTKYILDCDITRVGRLFHRSVNTEQLKFHDIVKLHSMKYNLEDEAKNHHCHFDW